MISFGGTNIIEGFWNNQNGTEGFALVEAFETREQEQRRKELATRRAQVTKDAADSHRRWGEGKTPESHCTAISGHGTSYEEAKIKCGITPDCRWNHDGNNCVHDDSYREDAAEDTAAADAQAQAQAQAPAQAQAQAQA